MGPSTAFTSKGSTTAASVKSRDAAESTATGDSAGGPVQPGLAATAAATTTAGSRLQCQCTANLPSVRPGCATTTAATTTAGSRLQWRCNATAATTTAATTAGSRLQWRCNANSAGSGGTSSAATGDHKCVAASTAAGLGSIPRQPAVVTPSAMAVIVPVRVVALDKHVA